MEDWNKMTVAQLKTECTNRGLDTSGKKADLIQKLSQHEAAADEAEEAVDETAAEVEEEQNGEEETEAEAAEVEEEPAAEAAEEEETAQDGVDEVIDAIDDIIEEPEGDKEEEAEEEKTEETAEGEEKKDGEKEEEEEKAVEEKKETKPTPVKTPPVKVPIKKTVRAEVLRESRVRMVVFGPLLLEDLKNEKMLEILKKAEQFFIRFALEGEPGHAQLRLKTFEEAKELAESIAADPFKENIVVKQLEPDLEQNAKIDALLKGETEKTLEAIELRMLYVHNVPETESVTEDTLKQLVPEALSAIIPKDDDRKSKGYAYLEFEDSTKMEEFIKKVDNLTLENIKMTLHKIPTTLNEDKPQRPRYQNYNKQQNSGGNRRGDFQRGGYNNRGGRQGMDNRQQGGRWNDYRGANRGYNQGGSGGSGVGGQEAVSLLMGISQMLSSQQQPRGMAPPPRGYPPQRSYDDHYSAGYADQGRKRRYEDNYAGGYNQGAYQQGGYGGGPNKRFNPGRRY